MTTDTSRPSRRRLRHVKALTALAAVFAVLPAAAPAFGQRPATPTTTLTASPIPTEYDTVSSSPSKVVDAGGTGFFIADVVPPVYTGCKGCGPQETRRGLHRTDGTSGGTRLVATLPAPIVASSMRAAGGRVYFTLDRGEDGTGPPKGLWASDGTEQGTTQVWPQPGATVPHLAVVAATRERVLFIAIPVNDTATDGQHEASLLSMGAGETDPTTLWSGALETVDSWSTIGKAVSTSDGVVYLSLPAAPGGPLALWRTDGTAEGTRPTGIDGARPPIAVRGTTLWLMVDGRIVRSDGTPQGTQDAPAAYPEGAVIRDSYGPAVAATTNRLFFIDTASGEPKWPRVVWSTDGSTVRQESAGIAFKEGEGAGQVVATPARALFVARDQAGVRQVWGSDGSGAPEQLTQARNVSWDRVRHLDAAGALAYFQLGNDLFASDGTAAGTRTIHRGPALLGDREAQFSQVAGRTVFSGQHPVFGVEPWTTDGTADGTRLLSDALPAPYAFFGAGSVSPATLGGAAIFVRRSYANSLWRSDGTAAGTGRLAFLPQSVTGALRRSGRFVYLTLNSWTDGGVEVWRTDGTPAGTIALTGEGLKLVEDLTPKPGGGVVFTGPGKDGRGRGLWASDGTAEGTRRIAELPVGPHTRRSFGSDGERYTASGRHVFFALARRPGQWRLWRTDGTAAGTRMVDGVRGRVSGRASIRGRLWFARESPGAGVQLWSTDGSSRGTRRETDVAARAGGGLGHVRAMAGSRSGRVLFSARAAGRDALWATTNAAGGATRLTELPAPASDFGLVGGRVVFVVRPVWKRERMWASDGTKGGTQELRAFISGDVTRGVDRAGHRYFETGGDAYEGVQPQLWRTNGTPGGTRRVKVRSGGKPARYRSGLMVSSRGVLFTAAGADGGRLMLAGK